MEAGLNGLETTFAMILITIKNAFMMMETAVDYQHKRTFASNALVKVSWNIYITKYLYTLANTKIIYPKNVRA